MTLRRHLPYALIAALLLAFAGASGVLAPVAHAQTEEDPREITGNRHVRWRRNSSWLKEYCYAGRLEIGRAHV